MNVWLKQRLLSYLTLSYLILSQQEQAFNPKENVTIKKSTGTPPNKSKQEIKKRDKVHVNLDEVVSEMMEEDMADDKKSGKGKKENQ